ncbi:hypothetical protein [Pseudomonas laurylsulfatiphila]|uniref:hypothetical protein n=1 Tax=Pseudomonas laurylsulfatiphila TaxID=2011015 RepID=UPI0011B04477|nr:hypothetical protein [Pseudomonas laurylsulfatiphila]
MPAMAISRAPSPASQLLRFWFWVPLKLLTTPTKTKRVNVMRMSLKAKTLSVAVLPTAGASLLPAMFFNAKCSGFYR